MNEEQRQAKNNYNSERMKQLYQDKILKKFVCDLPYEEAEEINHFLAQSEYTKKDIVRAGYIKLKEEQEKSN